MATSNNVLISVQNLVKEYNHGAVHALNDCNLEIRKGEVVAIIGPSGSGKSTLLRSLNLLEQPTSGAIYFDGVDLADKSVDINLHRQKMGMVFQHFNLFPNKTVLDNLTTAPIKIKKQPKGEAEEKAMPARHWALCIRSRAAISPWKEAIRSSWIIWIAWRARGSV